MPASQDKLFYAMLDSIANTTHGEDAIAQNKRIKEAEFAEDSREPTPEEVEILKAEVLEWRARDAELKHKRQPDLNNGPSNSTQFTGKNVARGEVNQVPL